MNNPSRATDANKAELIGGRYRIDAELGRGGMARVYRVTDERSGERFALKKLVASGERSATLYAMFEHEYHTLVQLTHPRIVRVFDYGLDADSPFYTMELLEGCDVRELLRTGTPTLLQRCILLRDAASALALIHSRRMVHRDVSPRNLWCLPDGRGKLIDFGTLVAMGPQTRVAGTAPFMPPEAVHSQPLDARCDIYALGALGYYMLTGRHAYPAREIADLRAVWRRAPLRPDALADNVPRALADLIMAMLSLDARARPASASEVFERINAACELPVEDERRDAQSFLATPKLVGRDDERGALSKRLLRAVRGRGSAVSVVAPAGLGRSRMLANLVIEAKLLGAAVINIDASAVGTGPLAVVTALAERLLAAAPMAAAAATGLAPVLAHLSPGIQHELGQPALAQLHPLERALKLSSALVHWVDAITRDQRLLIAVDDVHRADGASLGVLAKLSLIAPERRLLLVTSCDAGALAQPPPALEQLCQERSRMALAPLGREHIHELLESLFGAGPGLDEAAGWLHELSHGSPQACMQYAQYLVDHGIARYESGHWKLPARLREQALPPSLAAMLEAQLATMSEDARALALGLALARDDSRALWQPETHVRLEDYPKLIGGDAARAFKAIDELLQNGVIQQRDACYVLGQRAMTDALLRITDEATRKRAHALVADVFLQEGYRGGYLGVYHLQLAGEHQRARDLIAAGSERMSAGGSYPWGSMRLSLSTGCGIQALAHYHAHPGSPREGVLLRRVLALACSVYDWSNARVTADQMAQLRADCGMGHWDETDSAQPPLARLVACLQYAQQRYERTPEAERGFAALEAVRELSGVCTGAAGAFLHMNDARGVRSVPPVIAPLRPLSPALELLGQVCDQAVARVTGKELGDGPLRLAQEIGRDAALPEILRIGLSVIRLHEHVVDDARRGRPRAVELLDLLALLIGNDMFYIIHGRWLAYAFAGNAKLAAAQRKQVEVITEDDIWRRKSFLAVEAQLHALTGDLHSLQRTHEAIAELADKFPGWRPYMAWTHAEIDRLRGDLDAAHGALQNALELAQPGEHRAWVLAAPAYAELLLARGDVAGALREADAIVEHVSEQALDRTAAVEAERVAALAHSRRLEHAAAQARIERAFQIAHELGYGGLPLSRLYEAQAAIAHTARDQAGCAAALKQFAELLEHADAPALFQAYGALREAANDEIGGFDVPAPSPVTRALTDMIDTFTQIRTRLTALDDRGERARHALRLLLEDSGAAAGHLFLFGAEGPFAAASSDPNGPGEPLITAVRQYLDAELRDTKTAVVTSADIGDPQVAAAGTLADGERRLVPVLLCDGGDEGNALAGIALLVAAETQLRAPRAELARAIARCLITTGDSIALSAEGD